jgi:hypothetical protein
MFACDIGLAKRAVSVLAWIYEEGADEILPKWRYLKQARPDFLTRYAPLFAYLGSRGAI